MLNFRKAQEKDCTLLTALSKAAFDTDVTVGGTDAGGPPQYDSLAWHLQMAREEHLFVLEENGLIVAGAVLFGQENTLYIGRIFVAPAYFRQGLGLKLMKCIESGFPSVTRFSLDTPAWNVRTNAFYKKCGYRVVKTDSEMVYYEKVIN